MNPYLVRRPRVAIAEPLGSSRMPEIRCQIPLYSRTFPCSHARITPDDCHRFGREPMREVKENEGDSSRQGQTAEETVLDGTLSPALSRLIEEVRNDAEA